MIVEVVVSVFEVEVVVFVMVVLFGVDWVCVFMYVWVGYLECDVFFGGCFFVVVVVDVDL